MKLDELKAIDSEDLLDFFEQVEASFQIKFLNDDLSHITTFGQMCDHIADKIQLDHQEDCTSQQAFYKLRDALSTTLSIDKRTILPNLPLPQILPWRGRRKMTAQLESNLGFELRILQPPNWLIFFLLILMLASIVCLFFNWIVALLGFVFAIGGFRLGFKFGKELEVQTVGQLASKMTRENYSESRRNPKTFNKGEVEKILKAWLSDSYGLDKSKLTRNTTFQ